MFVTTTQCEELYSILVGSEMFLLKEVDQTEKCLKSYLSLRVTTRNSVQADSKNYVTDQEVSGLTKKKGVKFL